MSNAFHVQHVIETGEVVDRNFSELDVVRRGATLVFTVQAGSALDAAITSGGATLMDLLQLAPHIHPGHLAELAATLTSSTPAR